MNLELEKFGSVFVYNEQYFVYFGFTKDGRLFAARILDEQKTLLIQKMSDKCERLKRPMKDSLSLCFVVLKTEDFAGQAVVFHRTGDNVDSNDGINFLGRTLNAEDVQELKKIILNDKAMPKSLIEIVKDINDVYI